jgi:hypothetical protein
LQFRNHHAGKIYLSAHTCVPKAKPMDSPRTYHPDEEQHSEQECKQAADPNLAHRARQERQVATLKDAQERSR